MSAPASSKWVAKLCRSVCGLARRESPATARCFSSSLATPRTESLPPNRLVNRGRGAPRGGAIAGRGRAVSHACNAVCACEPTIPRRSRRPFPRTRMVPPRRSRSASSRPTSSRTRTPDEYISSRIARSRRPPASAGLGAASSRPISSPVRNFGSLRERLGLRSGLAGLVGTQPSR